MWYLIKLLGVDNLDSQVAKDVGGDLCHHHQLRPCDQVDQWFHHNKHRRCVVDKNV